MPAPNVDRFLAELGLEPPAGLRLANELRQAISVTANVAPVADLEAEILSGRLTPAKAPARVAEVGRLLTERASATEVARGLEPALDRLARQALRDNAGQLVEAMRPAFDEACATVVASTDLLGEDPDPGQLAGLGAAAAVAWEHRQGAVTKLHAIHRIRQALEQVGYGTGSAANYLAAIPNGPALEQATQVFRGKGEGIARLAAAGYLMRLNSAAEANQVAEGARLASEEDARRLQDEAKELNRKSTQRYIDDWAALAPKAGAS